MAESEKDAQARWILRKDLPMCVCKPTNPRHRESWQCVTPEQLRAWKKKAETVPHIPVVPEKTAKRLASLWLQFSTDPEAKRLSGRTSPLGLDTWDDAAGMSELEKRMFE